jgi:bacterioferritin-associated ferredoxin
MSARPHPVADATAAPPMTGCACTGRSFAEVERRMHGDRLLTLEAERLTGCGSLCTACLPDLRAYLVRKTDPSPKQEWSES